MKTNRWMKFLLLSGVLSLLGVGTTIFLVMRSVRKPPALRTFWNASSGEPVPERFCFLAMPRDANVVLYAADGSPTGRTLKRALMCSSDELSGSEWVGVWYADGDTELKVLRKQLVLVCPDPGGEALIENWKKTVKSWGREKTDWRYVDVAFEERPAGTWIVKLKLKYWKGDFSIFTYTTSGESAAPQSWQVNVRELFPF